jgi:L-alanine-DL-glutamate epimerase-like enolase superfamily enzyme
MDNKAPMNRRAFLRAAAGSPLALHTLAAQHKGKVKITDVKVMIVRGTWDWNLVRVDTDAGVYGLGEAYWGYGVKDLILNQLKPLVVGEDPFNVDKLYTKMLMRSAGQGALAGITVTAASGVEIALWDLAGRLLQTPACNLLGGRFRDRVRFYRTLQVVRNPEDMQQWREQIREAKAEKFGWTAFKFQGDGIPPTADPQYKEPGHDPYTRGLTNLDLRRIAKAMETVREELGPDVDFGVEAHWKYDVRDAINMAKAIEPVKPMWLEDPVPPGNPDAMARVTHAVDVPIATGENLYTRDGFRRLIELHGCDIVHIDIPKSGGLLESKRIHDLADNYYISTAAHNPASPVGTIASAHAAASMRDFRIHELAKYIDWWQDLVVHDGPIFENGYYRIRDKPGFGIELNPDVAKAHLAPGEKWWS